MNTSLARKLLSALLAVASVGACLFVLDTPTLRPQAPGPVSSNALDKTQALKQILVADVPTPWPPSLSHIANNVSEENHAATMRRLVADGPTPWPQAHSPVSNNVLDQRQALNPKQILMADVATPWPQATGADNV